MLPSLELCAQLRREVHRLWPADDAGSPLRILDPSELACDPAPTAEPGIGAAAEAGVNQVNTGAVNVAGVAGGAGVVGAEASENAQLLRLLGESPLIAGTPHTLLRLFGSASASSPPASQVLGGLRTLVLDEADQLLR